MSDSDENGRDPPVTPQPDCDRRSLTATQSSDIRDRSPPVGIHLVSPPPPVKITNEHIAKLRELEDGLRSVSDADITRLWYQFTPYARCLNTEDDWKQMERFDGEWIARGFPMSVLGHVWEMLHQEYAAELGRHYEQRYAPKPPDPARIHVVFSGASRSIWHRIRAALHLK